MRLEYISKNNNSLLSELTYAEVIKRLCLLLTFLYVNNIKIMLTLVSHYKCLATAV